MHLAFPLHTIVNMYHGKKINHHSPVSLQIELPITINE